MQQGKVLYAAGKVCMQQVKYWYAGKVYISKYKISYKLDAQSSTYLFGMKKLSV